MFSLPFAGVPAPFCRRSPASGFCFSRLTALVIAPGALGLHLPLHRPSIGFQPQLACLPLSVGRGIHPLLPSPPPFSPSLTYAVHFLALVESAARRCCSPYRSRVCVGKGWAVVDGMHRREPGQDDDAEVGRLEEQGEGSKVKKARWGRSKVRRKVGGVRRGKQGGRERRGARWGARRGKRGEERGEGKKVGAEEKVSRRRSPLPGA